jgi:DNA-binding NarL/FixJ family response regulator
LKQVGSEDLVKAIRGAARGEAALDPALTQRVFTEVREAIRSKDASAFSSLTEQEIRVLSLVAEGKTNRDIAKRLFLGEGTVRNYVSSLLAKLQLSNRAEAAAFAVEHNLKDFLANE